MTIALDNLDASLPAAYDTDAYRVGYINGLLDALAAIHTGVNHAVSAGLVELARDRWQTELPGFAKPPGSTLVTEPLPKDWLAVVRTELARVFPGESSRDPIIAIIHKLTELVRGRTVLVHRLVYRDPAGQPVGVVGFIADATFAISTDDRVFVLAAGWSD